MPRLPPALTKSEYIQRTIRRTSTHRSEASTEALLPARTVPGERHRVKVPVASRTFARIPWRASLAALASALVAVLGLFPTTAHAITRAKVLDRAHHWVAKKVTYSQNSTFAGYRRDCSGFVSMAWKLGRSYTSRTIHAVAVRIPLAKMQPGDAVHTPGHVAIFVKWANKAHSRYVAMEESTWGRPALKHARPLGRGAKGLRYRHIAKAKPQLVAPPLTGVSPIAAGTVAPSGNATAAASVLATQATAAFLSTDAAPTLFVASASQPLGLLALVPAAY